MLTTGIKQLIINNAADITTYATASGELLVKGLPAIKASEISKLAIYEPHAEIPGIYTYAIAATSALGAGEEFVAVFDMKSFRNQGNFFGNRYDNTDQFVLQCKTVAGTAAGIVDGIVAAFGALSNEDKARYSIASITNGGNSIVITMTEWSVYPDLMKVDDAVGSSVNLTITRTQTAYTGLEGRGLPKYLKEVVAANTFANTSAYGMKNENQVNMNTRYTLMSFDVTHKGANGAGTINAAPATKVAQYELWIDEDINLATAKVLGAAYDTAATFYKDAAPTGTAFAANQAAAIVQEKSYAKGDGDNDKIYVKEAYV